MLKCFRCQQEEAPAWLADHGELLLIRWAWWHQPFRLYPIFRPREQVFVARRKAVTAMTRIEGFDLGEARCETTDMGRRGSH